MITTGPAVSLTVAAALLVAGPRVAGRRLSGLTAAHTSPAAPPPVLRVAWLAVGAVAVAAAGWALAGAAAAIVGGLLALAAGFLLRRRLAATRGASDDGAELAGRWELLAVCLEAGLPVAVAVTACAASLAGPAGQGLRRVAGLLELGADPADAWRSAVDHSALAPFARVASRSAATGAGLAQVARSEGGRLRAELTDSAQERAQRAAVLITGPLGLCFLPAFLVLGIAPVVIGLAGQALARW